MAVDNTEWDGPAAMSRCTQSDDPAAAYAAICAGRRDGDPTLQSTWALPHHKNPGDPPNASGVRNSLSRLPQTEGLTNEEEAQAHLEAHLAAIREEEGVSASFTDSPDFSNREVDSDEVRTLNLANETFQVLSKDKRRIGLRIVPYNEVAVHPHYGALMFEPGAFGQVEPETVRLRMDHEDPPTGLGASFNDLPDAPYMEFLVSRTERGNDQLTLAEDGVARGASVGYSEIKGKPKVRQMGGRNVTVYPPNSVVLHEVSTTWQPTFGTAGVMYVLSRDEKGTGPQMAEDTQEAPAGGAHIEPGIDYDRLTQSIVAAQVDGARGDKIDKLLAAFEQNMELQRAAFNVPKGESKQPKLANFVEVTLRRMRGESISPTELKELALDDVVTTEQPGLVPTVFSPQYDDLINQDRPFLSSTLEISPPSSGLSMILPVITTRAVAGTQAGSAEKGALTTTATKVGTGTFSYQSVFGGADISIQMINRAERGFFEILTGDMGMAYALDCDSKALTALLAGYTDSAGNGHLVNSGGVMDPEDPEFGTAWVNSITSGYKRAPTHIWLSSQAVGAFIDAKAPVTNAPLYSNLAASFTAAAGTGGRLSGLIPVYVPALDTSGIDIIVGPSRGFVWAEDPALRLEADNPAVAGRDIALAGGIFPAPRYADAFTVYNIAS